MGLIIIILMVIILLRVLEAVFIFEVLTLNLKISSYMETMQILMVQAYFF